MPHDVFISYVEEDRTQAIQTCDVLELAGIHCWIAPRDITPGRTWGAAIIEAITQCRVMVLIFSSRTNLSRQVARELERADSKRVRVVPFRIENAPPSGDLEFFLGSIQWVDAFEGPFETHLARLSKTLHALLEEIGTPDRPLRDDREDERSVPRAEERVLDAALSKRVPVAKPTELVAMVRLTDSPGLRATLEIDDEFSLTPEDVRSEGFQLEFPVNADGQSLPVQLTLRIDSPDFEPKVQQKKILVPPDTDSEAYVFLLIPKFTGQLIVNVEVYKGAVAVSSRFLKTTAEPSEREVLTQAKTLVSIPFYVVGYAPGPSERLAGATTEPAIEVASSQTEGISSPSEHKTEPERGSGLNGSADPREATSFPGSVETAEACTSSQPTTPAPGFPKPIESAPKRSPRRSWIGGLSAVAALFICGTLVMLQLRQKPEVTPEQPPKPTATVVTPGGSLPTPPQALPNAQSGTMAFATGTVDATGRITQRNSGEAQVRVEQLAPRVKLTMVEIQAGRLLMGSSPAELRMLRQEYLRHGATPAEAADVLRRETPQHSVRLKSFLIGSTEVTRAQWAVVASWKPVAVRLREDPPEIRGAELPVTNVSWRDADEFCQRLSAKTKRSYRLPSEAEWEYACRAGTTGPFNLGSTISPTVSNYHSRFPFGGVRPQHERGHTVVVGQFRLANAFGLYDMHGNVWEWCADSWHSDYSGAPSDGRVWIDGGDDSRRPVRGGGWNDIAFFARSSQRASQHSETTSAWIGFRVVMEKSD
jgi:formylglycine-generating enzyme required for sulfatase activity